MQTRDSITDVWGPRTPYLAGWPDRVDERTLNEPDAWVQSACVLCSNGCGLDIGVKEGTIVGVRGRQSDRINQGRLGPKGLHGWEANASADRLKRPLIREGPRFVEASWDAAMDLIARRSREVQEKYTSHAIAFYLSGQLFLEEYYACSLIAKAGLGTPHLDSNTRLCTASSEAALRESFGSDGEPGSIRDFDTTEALLHVGHNIASQQTVLWSRILDRRRGTRPPTMIVVDPRLTETAREADLHLPLRAGTNLALMNGLLHLLIRNGHLDSDYIERHTVGFDDLARRVAKYTPAMTATITGLTAKSIEAAGQILGTTPSLCSTVLQGVYQSSQAVASAVQVNNLHLLRGLVGKPGSSPFQMNGQPTASNTRECGCQGALPFFLNKENPDHVRQLAASLNVVPGVLPSWVDESHLLQTIRYAEEGSIRFLWIACTNPAVSMPELARFRKALASPNLFVVLQDAFLTETAQLADVVLPAAIWGEKTGTFTNIDRTVHISYKATDPPGEARSDLDIFLDYARRMDFRDKDGAPLIKFSNAEEAFSTWKEKSSGKWCDYSGLSYERLTGGSGIQWPCNEQHPDGRERLYEDGNFRTAADVCQAYGHNLITGAPIPSEEYRANDPGGRAILKSADYEPSTELPDKHYPFHLTTGRVIHQFHTRTKTGHSQELQRAAPAPYLQISSEDAEQLRIRDGDSVRVSSRRGQIVLVARIGGIRPKHLFIPFHYAADSNGNGTSPNELIATQWDPISKQPCLKAAAVRVRKVSRGTMTRKPDQVPGLPPKTKRKEAAGKPERKQLIAHLDQLRKTEISLAKAWSKLATRYKSNFEIMQAGERFSFWSKKHASELVIALERYGGHSTAGEDRLRIHLFRSWRHDSVGLLSDLQDVTTSLQRAHISYVIVGQAVKSLRDAALANCLDELEKGNHAEIVWCLSQLKAISTQVLVAPGS